MVTIRDIDTICNADVFICAMYADETPMIPIDNKIRGISGIMDMQVLSIEFDPHYMRAFCSVDLPVEMLIGLHFYMHDTE